MPNSRVTGAIALMGEDAAAEVLGVSVRTLQRWRVEGHGPAFRKIGKRVAYTNEDLEEFIQAARRTSTSQPAA